MANFSFDMPSAERHRASPVRPACDANKINNTHSPFSSNDFHSSNNEYKPGNPFAENSFNRQHSCDRDRYESRQDSPRRRQVQNYSQSIFSVDQPSRDLDHKNTRQPAVNDARPQPRNTRKFDNSKNLFHDDDQFIHDNQNHFLNERKYDQRNTNSNRQHHSPQIQHNHQKPAYPQQQHSYYRDPQQQQYQQHHQQHHQKSLPQPQKHHNRYQQQHQEQRKSPQPQRTNRAKNKGNERKVYWKDKKLESSEDQLQYIGHCRSWCKSDKEESYVVEKIREANEPLESILEDENLHYDVIRQLIDLLSRKNFLTPHSSCCQSANVILSKTIDSKLIHSSKNLSGFLTDLFEDINDNIFLHGHGNFNDNRKVVLNVSQLLNTLLDRVPSEFQNLSVCITTLKDKFQNPDCANKFDEETQLAINELHTKYTHLKKKDKETQAKHHEKKQLEDDDAYYGNLYYDTSILPTYEELVNANPMKLRKLLTTEGYPNALRYLDMHFKLLREDMIRPLREGIQHYISNSKTVERELYIYHSVKITEMYCDQNQGLLYKISFKPFRILDPSKIKWDRSPRLKFGTLLLITPYCKDGKPNFEKGLWAVVGNRNEKELTKDLTISIKFDKNSYQPSFKFGVEYFMIESKQVYYEAYYHTLSVIQNMKPECLPLQKIILGQQKQIGPPQYLTENTKYLFGDVFPNGAKCIRTLGDWPKESNIFDESQLRALELALTKEVALIQGPPGTGKTYVGARVMRILLETRRSLLNPPPPEMELQNLPFRVRSKQIIRSPDEEKLHEALCQFPMLVVTYTNHALDQFLEYLLGFEPKILRIGSKIEKEELKNKTLHVATKEILSNHSIPPEIRKFRQQRFDIRKDMESKKDAILNFSKILIRDLTMEDFQNLVTPEQFNSLYADVDDGFEMVTGKKSIILAWLDQYTYSPSNTAHSQSESATGGSNNSKKKKGNKNTPVNVSNRFASLVGMDVDNEDTEAYNIDDIQRKRLENLGINITDEHSQITGTPLQSSTYSNVSIEFNDTYNRKLSTPTQTFTNIEFTHADRMAAQPTFELESAIDEYFSAPIYTNTQTDNQLNKLLDDETFLHHASDDDDYVDAFDTDTFDGFGVNRLTIDDAMQMYGNNPQEGSLPNLLPRILDCNNLWSLSHIERKQLYDYLILRRNNETNQVLSALSTEYSNLSKEFKEKQRQIDVYVLKQSAVVGMTTTGAARYTELLKELKPKIIFIEEAAEVLEAHVIACLSEHVEHLVLIGDHNQLKPSNAVHELTRKYNLSLSLFERLCGHIEHVTLNNQHRMRPEISKLVKPIYPDLVDHPVVLNKPSIKGVMKNVFFIDHRVSEDPLQEDTTSRKNIHEARFIAHFAKYLLKQGYDTSDITILTFYLGQKFKIMDQLKLVAKGYNIRVTTVDRFQGEENKIILFSVVRSNVHNDIGYCRVDNRVCVALSRAQDGFYMIGNSACLRNAKSDTRLWTNVFEQLGPDNIGTHLPLSCQKHPHTISHVATFQDFHMVKNGGCQLQCDERLNCGHQCQQLCHPDGHESVECKKDCERKLICGHRCYHPGGKVLKKCYEECGNCNMMVEKALDVCNHKMMLACHKAPVHGHCKMACIKMLPCNHRCQGKCGEDCMAMNCFIDVNIKLYCKHTVTVPCWKKDHLLEEECKIPCDHVLKCGDVCTGTCGSCLNATKHAKCKNTCKAPLICQHEWQENCHRPSVCLPCKKKCIIRCMHTKCGKYCGEICVPCIERCEWKCWHMACNKKCFEPCNRLRCDRPCQISLSCRHPCLGLCGEPCPQLCRCCDPDNESFSVFFGSEDGVDARFVVLEDCGHMFEKIGLDHWMDIEKGGRTDKDKIQLPKCPRCNTPIRKNLRYGAIVKQALSDIEAVKKRVIDEMRKSLTKESTHLLEKIQLIRNKNQFHKQILDYIHDAKACIAQCDHLKLYIVLDLLNAFAKIYDHSEQLWKNGAAHRTLLQGPLLNNLLKKNSYSELDDWDRDCFMAISRRCEISSLFSALTPGISDLNDGSILITLKKKFMNSIMYSINPKNLNSNNLMRKCEIFLSNVRLKYSFQPPSLEELREIAQIVDVNRHGWYKCPNGHLYGIGECGGAEQISKCPECGATIGGTSHQVTSDNTYAGREMGTAAEPPDWSNPFGAGNNMFF